MGTDPQGPAAEMRSALETIARYELLLLAGATPFLLFPGTWTPLGVAIIALAWASRWLATGRISKPTSMDLPIIVLILTLGVSLIPAVDLDLALNRLWVILLGIAWFYGVVNGLDSGQRINLMGLGLVVLGLVVAVFSLLSTDFETAQVVELPAIYDRLPPPLIRGLPGSGVIEEYDLVNPRVLAGALAILIPIPLSYLALGNGWGLRALSALSALVMAAVLCLTQAPQGLLGLLAALLLIGLFYSRWLLVAIPAGAISVLASAALWRNTNSITDWLPSGAVEYLTGSLQRRVGIWNRVGWMIRDMPFSGIGLNNYPRVAHLYSIGPNYDPHAHNTLLQTALDLGLPGLVVVLALLAGFGYTVARTWRGSLTRNQRALLIGLCGTVAAWLSYGMLDTLTLGHKSAVVLWIALGTAAALRSQVEPPRSEHAPLRSRRKMWALTLPALLLVALALPQVVAAYHLNLGVMASHKMLGPGDTLCSSQDSELAAVARNHLHDALRWNQACGRAHYWLGWLHACLGEQDQAIDSLLRAVELDQSDKLAHYLLGQLLHQAGDHEQAVQEWSLAGTAGDLWYQARLLWAEGDVNQARGLLEAVTSIDPSIEDAWLMLGSSYEQEQRWEEALQTYMDCIQYHASAPEAYVRAAELLYRTDGEPSRALELLDQALATCEDTGQIYLNVARMHYREHRLEEAEALALKAAQESPTSGETYIFLGDLYVSQERYDQALEAYTSAVNIGDNWRDHWSARLKMGDTLLATGQPVLAIEEYQAALELGIEHNLEAPSLARTYVAMGDALVEQRRVGEAITAYERALEIDPDNTVASKRLEQLGQTG
jgi:tetratricopeptide (TPR) repeat protein/O-antigen ligase